MLVHSPSRLAASVVVLVAVMGTTALLAISQVVRSSAERERNTRAYVEELVLAERLRGAEERMVAVGRGHLLVGGLEPPVRLLQAEAELAEILGQLEQRVRSAEGQVLLARVRSASGEYQRSIHRVIQARHESARAGDLVRQLEEDVAPDRRRLDAAIDAFVELKQKRLDDVYAAARGEALKAGAFAITGVVLVTGLCALLAWTLSRQLLRAYGRERSAVEVAERALRAREELLGIVAHDLRSPLAAMSIRGSLLRKSSSDEKARRHGEAIEHIGRRMEQVIRSLLDASSIEAGRFSVAPAPCVAQAILDEAEETLGALASSKAIDLVFSPAPPALGVKADRDRVVQVLTNLVGNAVKFTPEGGLVAVSAEATDEGVRFSVRDSGPGIAAEQVPRLFDRFWKGEKSNPGGTGLGLYIAKAIVEAHGGRIWLDTVPGQGTTFHFVLTSAEVATEQRDDSAEPAHS